MEPTFCSGRIWHPVQLTWHTALSVRVMAICMSDKENIWQAGLCHWFCELWANALAPRSRGTNRGITILKIQDHIGSSGCFRSEPRRTAAFRAYGWNWVQVTVYINCIATSHCFHFIVGPLNPQYDHIRARFLDSSENVSWLNVRTWKLKIIMVQT